MHDILFRFEPNVRFCLHGSVKERKVRFTDISPLGAALMHADGQTDRQTRTDMMKITGALLEYPKPSKTE